MKITRVRSLRFKLSWTHGLVIAMVVACFGFIRYQSVSYRARRSFDQNLLQDAQFFTARLTLEPDRISLSTDGLTPAGILKLEEFRSYFLVTDLSGKVMRPDLSGPFQEQMLRQPDTKAVLQHRSGFGQVRGPEGNVYRFVSLPYPHSSAPLYIVHVGRFVGAMQDVLDEYRLLYIYSVPLILLISAGVGWILAGRALRPFAEVARAAEQITSENLSTQIVSPYQEQEVSSLVRSFNAMVSRLEQSFRQLRQFNADAAHELRTPLAILQGENEIALRSPSVPDEVRALLASNLEELERLTRIVNDMLTLAEAEAGKQVLKRRPLDLKALVEDLVDQIRLLAADREIEIDVLDIPEARVEADELWIRRAFLNVLDNSIKYSKEGGRIQVTGQIDKGMVRIEVRDYGIGIAPEDLPRIFDRLYRTDPARSRHSGGVGLGLSLVRWIVEAHSGRVSVSSRPAQGTTFTIMLPLIGNPAHRH